MSDRTKKYIEELNEGVKALFTSKKWKDYLTFLSRFHAYSVNNTIAIYTQRPDASLVASMSTWNKLGRFIRKGERGIKIISPHDFTVSNPNTGKEEKRLGFHMSHCFDVSQTEGKDLPESPCRKLTADVNNYDQLRDALCAISPVPVVYCSFDSKANGYFSAEAGEIVVQDNLSQAQSVQTTLHELAHALLHAKGAEGEKTDRRTREVQAECVAYTVCQYLGIDSKNYSFGYIAGWSKNKTLDELKASIEVIARTSDRIIKGLEELIQ